MIGGDTSRNVGSGDDGAIGVLDCTAGMLVARWKGKVDTEEFGDILNLYKKYPESIDEAFDNRLLEESNIEDILEKIRHDVEKAFLQVKKGEVNMSDEALTTLVSNSALFDDEWIIFKYFNSTE